MTIAHAVRAVPLVVREASAEELRRWDELVGGFDNHRVVHTLGWLRSLEDCRLGAPRFLVFEKGGAVVACLPGLLVHIGPLRLFGSPLPGWQTVSMGPAFDPARVSAGEMMRPLVPFLREHYHVHHVEILSNALDDASMRAVGFRGQPVPTFRARLFPGDEARALKALKDSARRNVRRGKKLGLIVRFETDEAFVDEHFAQIEEVFARGGHSLPFTKERVRQYFRHMQVAGHLIASSVYLPDATTNIATAMFTIERKELLLWMWAHRTRYRWYRPTELMTWTVMQRAMDAGCDTFDLMGRGHFKSKFGAEPDLTKRRWVWSRYPILTIVRDLAERGYRWQQAVRGQVRRWAMPHATPVIPEQAEPEEPATSSPVAPNSRRRSRPAGQPAPLACVMGDIDLVRAVALGDIPLVVATKPGSPARYSRYARRSLDWADAWEQPDEAIRLLLQFGAAQAAPPVLFYEEDRELLLISRHRRELATAFRFVVPDATLVEDLVDKERFQILAARLALPVPPALALDPGQPLPPEVRALRFPMIVKPLTRRTAQWAPLAGSAKAIEVRTPAELGALWPRLAAAGIPALAQEIIPGPETAIESYHVYVDTQGRIVGEFTGRKIRTLPEAFGDSTALITTDAADVAELGRDLVRKLDLRGVAKFDFKRGPDGCLYLLEVNPRFTLWHHLAAVAGVNIPALVYADLAGLPRPAADRARAGVRWCKVWRDRAAARRANVPLWRWLVWALACEAKSGLAWDDPLPLVRAALHAAGPRLIAPMPSLGAAILQTCVV
ncbi:MAG TPA: GNAT family N-acetyltransferase [Gemmatimonadales bacterium]|nr:GNAT family N-acetyltransferase [Gemmatimonadales bacterium]